MSLGIRFLALSALVAALSGRASGALLGFDRPGDAFSPATGFHFSRLSGEMPMDPVPAADAAPPVPPPPPRLFDTRTRVGTAGIILGTSAAGYFAWWRGASRPRFESANERWFQRDTYAGGADKASHVFVGYASTLALQEIYQSFGKTPAQARGLALSVTALTGLLIEAGDGVSEYGFSWEDATSNVLGSFLATGIAAWGLGDTVGLRFGRVKALVPDACCRYGGYGDDYSKEIYSADVKLGGLLPRIGLAAGPARFLLLSMTYGSKGYRYSASPVRERNVGIEVGLNVREVLRALGVPDNALWGRALLAIGTYFRFPYTSFGWHYDLNHGRWSGPDTGDRFDPGSITYD